MNILVTGGAGYIGSTVANALSDAGHTPIILDNLSTGREEFTKNHIFYKGDMADRSLIEKIFKENGHIDCTIHFAALIVVPDSVARPYEYYYENVYKSLELFKMLDELGCHRIIFSSSASIYDDVEGFKVTEASPLKARSPYARTKYMIEMVLQDMCAAYSIKGIALRYFNPIGADPTMRTGNPMKISTLVVGKLIAAASGLEDKFYLTGVNWPTRDGSAIRDYIHVWDLARAHVKAVDNFDTAVSSEEAKNDYIVINLGMGNGVTVREIVDSFKKIYAKPLQIEEAPPRPGDVAGAYASNERALNLLGWKPELTIDDGIRDALKWDEVKKTILND